MKVIFTKGMQASGKSTWAKQFILDNPTYRRVNRDEIRRMINGYVFNDENEKQVTIIERNLVKQLLSHGNNVLIDAMHLNPKYIEDWKRFFITDCVSTEFSGYDGYTGQATHNITQLVNETEIKEFPITLAEAMERDKNRPDSLGGEILKKTWRTHELELKAMIERAKPKYIEDENLTHCIICDIDGTLSNSSHRRIFDEKEAGNDKVIEPVKELLQLITDSHNNMGIFIFSGRKDTAREITEKWLCENDIPYHKLFMRKAEDSRKDSIIKSELFEEHIRGKYYCDFVIDDRPDVCEMWVKEKGLFLFNVNQDPYCVNKF